MAEGRRCRRDQHELRIRQGVQSLESSYYRKQSPGGYLGGYWARWPDCRPCKSLNTSLRILHSIKEQCEDVYDANKAVDELENMKF